MKHIIRTVLVVSVLAATASACGGDPLADDPQGKKACETLVEAREAGDDVEQKVGGLLVAAKAAAESESDAIRESLNEPIQGLEQFPTVDQDALAAACEDAGVEVPDVAE